MKKLIFFISLSLLFLSCRKTIEHEEGFSFSGEYTHNWTVLTTVDSLGRFHTKKEVRLLKGINGRLLVFSNDYYPQNHLFYTLDKDFQPSFPSTNYNFTLAWPSKMDPLTIGNKAYILGSFKYEENGSYHTSNLLIYDAENNTMTPSLNAPEGIKCIAINNEVVVVNTLTGLHSVSSGSNNFPDITLKNFNYSIYGVKGRVFGIEDDKLFVASDNTSGAVWEEVFSGKGPFYYVFEYQNKICAYGDFNDPLIGDYYMAKLDLTTQTMSPYSKNVNKLQHNLYKQYYYGERNQVIDGDNIYYYGYNDHNIQDNNLLYYSQNIIHFNGVSYRVINEGMDAEQITYWNNALVGLVDRLSYTPEKTLGIFFLE